ncbi:Uncharacterised protein [Citrobacter freundii]|nr:Uncharacterised protein [Citrobacter freundii]
MLSGVILTLTVLFCVHGWYRLPDDVCRPDAGLRRGNALHLLLIALMVSLH